MFKNSKAHLAKIPFRALSAIFIITLSAACNQKRKLPFYGMHEVSRQVNGKEVIDSVPNTIPPFTMLNQDSVAFTNNNVKGKVYVADFFFTSCPSICPVMHRNLLKVYQKYKGHSNFLILSHTIDAKYDTPSRLKKYAAKLGVTSPQWTFLWGPKEITYPLAEKHYLVSVSQNPAAPGGFVHQGWLILVDGDGHVRGAYDGTDDKQVAQLIADTDLLLNP